MSAPATDSRMTFGAPFAVLAPRSINLPPRYMSQYKPQDIPFSKRAIKQAPLQSQAQLRETRRSNALSSTRAHRDERQFEKRADDMMRYSFLQQKRLWEAQLEEQGQLQSQDVEEEPEDALPEDIEREELQELEGLLSLLDEDDQMELERQDHDDHESEHYGSDDGDDFDFLMHEVAQRYDRGVQPSAQEMLLGDDQNQQADMMDTS